jgi:hypothetical protein
VPEDVTQEEVSYPFKSNGCCWAVLKVAWKIAKSLAEYDCCCVSNTDCDAFELPAYTWE